MMRHKPLLLPLILVVFIEFTGMLTAKHNGNSNDHGGVPMGAHENCDDGKKNITVDWDPVQESKEYNCLSSETKIRTPEGSMHKLFCTTQTHQPTHVCMNENITYEDKLPTSGSHRPVWPTYGEYVYLPPQRWLHSLEHGAVVFLYHPCADSLEVEELRKVAKSCLRRYIITPSRSLETKMPYALLTWGCKLLMNRVDVNEAKKFIQKHALKSPEKNVWRDGDYNADLKAKSEMVSGSNNQDSHLCPGFVPKPKRLDKDDIHDSRPRRKHLSDRDFFKDNDDWKHLGHDNDFGNWKHHRDDDFGDWKLHRTKDDFSDWNDPIKYHRRDNFW